MPLYSDHISNMYYSGSPSYTSSPYSYSSAGPSFGTSYSASYLNPGGSYSSHSSLGGYSRAPLSSRWLTSGGRAYSPMLSTISEKGTSSPVRINSPRRIHISSRSYVPSTFTLRPININTADIDVSRDKYRMKSQSSNSTVPTGLPPRRESPLTNKENGHDKPDTGIDTSPGPQRTTIKRDRAVVRLHTVKRRERDSPRKPVEVINNTTIKDLPKSEVLEKQAESKKWREKLADDLAYKTQKEKKTLGAKLVEKFTLKEKVEDEPDNCTKISPKTVINSEKSHENQNDDDQIAFPKKSVDRRCSMELLAEQASLLDSLIRRENLSTAPLDVSKVGAENNIFTDINLEPEGTKKRKLSHQENRLITTKSDHSLHDRLSSKDNKDPTFPKRRSLRKCSSGGNIRTLDCIKEISKKVNVLTLPPVEEKLDQNTNLKPKIKTKITSTVEVTPTTPQLKFIVENITVEEKSRPCKKDIIFSSTVDEKPLSDISTDIESRRNSIKLKKPLKLVDNIQVENISKDKNLSNEDIQRSKGHRKSIKSKIKDKSKPQTENSDNLTSPEPEDGNFWEKIGKRETIYLIKRKQNLEEAKEQSKRSLFWYPEEENLNIKIEENKTKTVPLLEEISDPNLVGAYRIDDKSNNTETSIPKEENTTLNEFKSDMKENTDAKIDGNCKALSKTSVSKDIDNSKVDNKPVISRHIETKETILDGEKVLITSDLTISENSSSKTRELDKASEKEKSSVNKVTEKIIQDQKIEFTADTVISKDILNKNESIAKDTESKSKSNDNKKFKVSEQNKKSLEEKPIEKQDASPQTKLSHSKEVSSTYNEKSKNISNNEIYLPKDLIDPINIEKTTAEHIELTTDTMKFKDILNKKESIAKDTESKSQSNHSKKFNVSEQNKKSSEENPNKKQDASPQTKLSHSKEVFSTNNEKSKNISNNQINLAKDLMDQINKEKTTVEYTELTADTVKSKDILNKNECIAKVTESKPKSKDSKKFNVSEQNKKSIEDNPIKKQNASPQAKLSQSKEVSSTNNEKSKNILNNQINLVKDLTDQIDIEKTTAEHSDAGRESKYSLKDKKTKVATISIPNNAQPILNSASLDDADNSNVPVSTTTEFCIDKSSKETNNEISEITKINAEELDIISTSSISSKGTSVISNTNTECKEDKVEPTISDVNIKIANIKDNKIQPEESYTNIKEDSSSNMREKNKDTTETNSNTKILDKPVKSADTFNVFTNMKPAKEEKALKPLIATPRPLQKRNPQTIRSSSSESSEDDSSAEDTEEDGSEDEGETGSSQGSAEFLECENNPDGRISTGSTDSGFDSSAPTSPSGFLHAKKGGDSPSTSAGVTPPQTFTHDILEQELEHSTAYDLFRRTGRFTPPARTIPRFRKYTIEDFQFIRVLGKGSFGKVMLAELRDTEYYYAVKCLKKDVVLEDDDVECTLIERKVLALGTNHPYLCHLFATFQTDSHLFFVMEYLNGGDLMFHIQQSGRFPEVRARFYAAEIVSGLKFLHKRGIVYRDLKLDNILLDFDGHVRIADFGMCKLQIYLDKTADTFCGTPDYMAPEIIKGLKYNQTVDWWSFGVLLYEMLIGQSPFSGCDEDELFWSICNEMPSYPRFLSSESLSILTRLLDKDARTRLGGPECMHGDIREQKFFEQISWDRLERRELEAPFKPRVRHPMDTQYFDRAFTGERPRLTAVEPQVLRSMDQEPFRGFSYTNPNATDR